MVNREMSGRRTAVRLKNRGFSLVELIIVIAIMAILAGALAPALIKYIYKSRRSFDLKTAEELGKGMERIVASDDETLYTRNSMSKTLVEWYMYDSGSAKSFQATDDDGNSYGLVCISQYQKGYNNDKLYNGGCSEQQDISDVLMQEIGAEKLKIKNVKMQGTNVKLDKFYICRRKDTNAVEVWVGTSGAQDGTPYCRLYPDVSDDYK